MNLYGREAEKLGSSPTGLAALEGVDEASSDMRVNQNLTAAYIDSGLEVGNRESSPCFLEPANSYELSLSVSEYIYHFPR